MCGFFGKRGLPVPVVGGEYLVDWKGPSKKNRKTPKEAQHNKSEDEQNHPSALENNENSTAKPSLLKNTSRKPCRSNFQERKVFVDLPQDIYGVAIAVAIGDLPVIMQWDNVKKARGAAKREHR